MHSHESTSSTVPGEMFCQKQRKRVGRPGGHVLFYALNVPADLRCTADHSSARHVDPSRHKVTALSTSPTIALQQVH